MTHEQCLDMLSAYIDGELPDVASVESHLASCPSCSARLAEYRQLSAAIGTTLRRQATIERAPAALRERVAAAVNAADATAASPWATRSQRRAWRVGAGLVAVAAAVVFAVSISSGRPNDGGVAREVLDSHIRSLAGDEAHLMDVVSTDQHTVKPWFNGKLDFAPTVSDFSVQGFPLLGGRVDYIDGQRVAALIYGRRKHKINLYEWPTGNGPAGTIPASELRLGYSMLHWTHAGIVYWAVSDVSSADLQELSRNIDSIGR
jgi:anti-sigma factor RsiW